MVEMNYCMNCPIEKDYEFTWNKTQDILSGIINDSKNFLDINIEKDESLNEKETIIKEQLPKKGIKLKAGSKVIISY